VDSREGRVPPNALEAERAVLGGVLLDNNVWNTVSEILTADDFYSEANKETFKAMFELSSRSEPIDAVTVREHLALRNRLQAIGGEEYLYALTNTIPTLANIEAHSKVVLEKSIVRRLILACHEVAATGYADYGELDAFVNAAEKKVFDVAKQRVKNPYEHVKDVFRRTFAQIQAAAERGDAITGIPSGFTRLDAMTAGMHPGDLIIVAGRPGMGKTSFALNVAVNAAKASGKAAAIFSLEMPKEQLANRMLSSEARVSSNSLRTGRLGMDDWRLLTTGAGQLADLPLWIDDTPGLTLMELRGKARRIQSDAQRTGNGLGLIVVDYLQLMRSGIKTDSREQEISEISRSLKGFAKELGIPIIALSQLNRGVESRAGKDKRPQLSDLRESGAIEQDADTILFVFREELYNKEDPSLRGVAEIIIGKQRAGATGIVRVAFLNEYTRFDNLADGYEEPEEY
jgi:replicative DNA helicase